MYQRGELNDEQSPGSTIRKLKGNAESAATDHLHRSSLSTQQMPKDAGGADRLRNKPYSQAANALDHGAEMRTAGLDCLRGTIKPRRLKQIADRRISMRDKGRSRAVTCIIK